MAADESMRLRPIREDDLPRLARLEAEVEATPWTIGNFKDALSSGYPGAAAVDERTAEHVRDKRQTKSGRQESRTERRQRLLLVRRVQFVIVFQQLTSLLVALLAIDQRFDGKRAVQT